MTRSGRRAGRPGRATWIFVVAYFLSYVPYAVAAKALSIGAPVGAPVYDNGLVLLPAVALGQLAALPLFLGALGWRRYAGIRRVLGSRVRFPGRDALLAGCCTAIVIMTTTLNLTFAHVSVLLMLLLMRGGVLLISPLVDRVRGRPISASAWVAFALSLAAVAAALSDTGSYRLTGAAALCAALYVVGYLGRFLVMGRVAKTGDEAVDRRYLVEEHAAAVVLQVLVLGGAALAGQADLREGIGSLLGARAAMAAGVGLLYQFVFVFGTLVYLDHRAFTWCVPANRCASLLAGLVAAYALTWWAGLSSPGTAQLVGLVLVLGACLALSWPASGPHTAPDELGHLRTRVDPVLAAQLSRPGLMEALNPLNPREDESHGGTEQVPRRAAGAGDPDGGRRPA